MSSVLSLIGREKELFTQDIQAHEPKLSEAVSGSRFLVLGGAGTIGQAVVKEIFKRNPAKLHVVDISENNLVELVRDLRSSFGHIEGDFRTFALDIGSVEYDAFFKADGRYDYILNLSALKHVRSEKDPYTLMRMVDVNVFNTDKTNTKSSAILLEVGLNNFIKRLYFLCSLCVTESRLTHMFTDVIFQNCGHQSVHGALDRSNLLQDGQTLVAIVH